jgi:NitT/TauT family transport system substrate-binding protein
MRVVSLWAGYVLAIVAALGASPTLAQPKPEKPKVVIAAGSTAGFYSLPLTVTDRLGLFKQAGLEVEIVDFPGGTKALQAVVGGSADIVSGAYEHTIHLQPKGQIFTVFVQMGVYPGLAVGLRADKAKMYKSPKDLKGLKIGVTSPGSGTHQLINYLLIKDGLKPDDVSIIGVGSGPGAVAAMESGQIDAISNIDPVMTQVANSGKAVIVVDVRTKAGTEAVFGTGLPSAALYAPEEFLARYPNTAQALADAMVKGLKWLKAATPEQLAEVVPPDWIKVNKEFYLAAFRNQREVFSADGLVSPRGAEKQLEVVREYSPEVRAFKVDLSKTYTNRFVENALKRIQ